MFASSRYRAVSGTVGRLDAPRVVPPGAPRARLASRIYVSFQTRNRSANGHKRGEVSGRVSESPSARGARAGGAGWTKMPDDRTPSSSLGVGTTRWASGGVINPSDPTPGASGRGVGSGAPSDGSRGWSAGAIPRAARGGLASSSTSAPRVDPTNVGFRMLRKAGWNVGEGLGKDKQGDTEPLRVWKKASRRGVGAECRASGHVVGEIPPEKRNPTPHSRRPVSGARAADDDESPVEPRDATAARVARQARDRRIAADVGRAFREEEARADENPLLRRRREREEEEARRSKSGGKRRRAGDDLGGGMSANNPLRGLF